MNTLRNNVQLIGKLGKDVEITQLPSGVKVAKMTLATNDYYKNQKGETIQNTQWHTLVAWGKMAENMESILHKGIEVSVRGKLQYKSYVDKKGNMRHISEVLVNEFVKITKDVREPLPF